MGEGLLQLDGRGDVCFQVALHQLVVGDDDALYQRLADAMLEVGHLRRDRAGAGPPLLVGDGAVAQEVGHPPEGALLSDGELEGGDARSEELLQLGEGALVVGPLPVELVDEDQAGKVAGLGEAPGCLRLHLDSFDGRDHHDGEVGDREGSLDLVDEVGVTGAVDEVDPDAGVVEGGESERDGDAVLLLFRLEVAHRRAVLHPTGAIDAAGAVQEGLGQGCLAGAAVADERDVADLGGRHVAHVDLLLARAPAGSLLPVRRAYRD